MIVIIHKQHDRSDRDRDWGDREHSRSRYQRRDRDSNDRSWQDSRQDEPTSVVILHGLDKDFKEEDVSCFDIVLWFVMSSFQSSVKSNFTFVLVLLYYAL